MDIYTILLVLFAITLLIAFYRYATEPYKYWKNLGVPSAPVVPLIGSLIPLFTRPMQDVIREWYEKYGRIFGQYEGRRPNIVVGDPELLRSILVKDFHIFPTRRNFTTGDDVMQSMVVVAEGETWKRIRTIMTPAFTTGKIKRMSNIFLDCARSLGANFDEAIDSGKSIDAKKLYGAFTMDVITNAAFGTKIDSHRDPDNPFVATARSLLRFGGIPWRFLFLFLFPKLFKLLKMKLMSPGPMEFFRKVTLQIIRERRRTGQVKNDFLQLLMDSSEEVIEKIDISIQNDDEEIDIAQEQSVKDIGHEEINEQIFKPTSYKSLSHDELLAQCILFFLAGYETTGTALSYVSYVLALHPECQEKLIEEIDDTLRTNDGEFTYENVQSMKYLEGVLCETLRMYPPALALDRVAAADYKLGNTGITIPKGMVVGIPSIGIHYDPEYYPDPEKFDPNRFTTEEKAKRNPYVFLPFGAGPRNCLGMRFALIEIKFCMAYVFSQFRMKRCPETKVPLDYLFMGQGMLQPKAIMLNVERRSDKIC